MAICKRCNEKKSWGEMRDGYCVPCHLENQREKFRQHGTNYVSDQQKSAASDGIILTTESSHNLPVAERLDIVTAECVVGMHLFKDIASALSDAFGGRSKTMQDALRDVRKTALAELRREAYELGADAVVGVDLDYSEISGGGKSMLFLVASGTAVRLEK